VAGCRCNARDLSLGSTDNGSSEGHGQSRGQKSSHAIRRRYLAPHGLPDRVAGFRIRWIGQAVSRGPGCAASAYNFPEGAGPE
jgi:hypothetical protein